MVVAWMRAGGRNRNRRERRRAAIRRHGHGPRIQHQRQGPAHALVLELLVLVVEDDHRQGRIGMGIREAREPALDLLVVLDHREGAFRRQVMHHVEVAVTDLDQPVIGGDVFAVDDEFRLGLGDHAQRRALPVLTLLPDIPGAVRIERVQRIGPDADRRVGVIGEDVLDLLVDMLGHDPRRRPAHREQRMEARVRGIELEMDGVFVGRGDLGDLGAERAIIGRAGRRLLLFDREHHVVGGELDAVAPEDALLELDGHLGEVGIILPQVVRQ